MVDHWAVLLTLGALGGTAAGAAFFGGLWWTSRRLTDGSSSVAALALSFVLRMLVLGGVLIVLARLDPLLLVGALPGLLAARMVWIRSVAPSETTAQPVGQGV